MESTIVSEIPVRGIPRQGEASLPSTTRYYALDSVRATAMLLGVFYHLPIAMMGGGGFGFGMGMGGGQSPKTSIDNWLHSFRMALFFLLSGFFANMVLGKYGLGKYLTRRWWRIGAPLVVSLFAFGLLRTFAPSIMSSAFGGMMDMAQVPALQPAAPVGAQGMPWGPGGAWPVGGMQQPQNPAAGGAPPWFGPGGAQPGFPQPGMPPMQTGMPQAPGMPGMPQAPAMPAMMPQMPQAPSTAAATWLFGKYAGNFRLEHLWFLWYLLLFVTVGPFVAKGFSLAFSKAGSKLDDSGRWMLRVDLMPLLLAMLSLPALVHARNPAGWSLMNPGGFMGAFPDFLWQYSPDLSFYLVYFLTGWWFFRLRSGLDDVARAWLWNLCIGIAAFATSQWMADQYALQAGASQIGWIRLGGFALYAAGSAYSAFGLIGLFQKFLDRPTKLGKYFTDTMLWVYLAQLAIIPHVINWIDAGRAAWWSASLAGMVVVTAIALVMFELFIRPTPLVHIFGPPMPRRRKPASAAV